MFCILLIRILFFFLVCPFCDEHMPFPLPERIESYLINNYQLDPKKGITLSIIRDLFSSVVEQYEFCRFHEAELKIVPEGLKKNYSIKIDFELLPSRVEELVLKLMLIIEGKESYYMKLALNAIKSIGKARSRMPTYLIGRFEEFQVI